MNRIALLQQDVAGIQAFLEEFGSCDNGEARTAVLSRTGELVLVRNFPLPDSFQPDHIDIMLVVSDYPSAPPVGVYVLNRNNAALMNRLQRVFTMMRDRAFYSAPAIEDYTWMCYHYDGHAWRFNASNLASGDNLRKFLLSFFCVCERDAI